MSIFWYIIAYVDIGIILTIANGMIMSPVISSITKTQYGYDILIRIYIILSFLLWPIVTIFALIMYALLLFVAIINK